MVARRPRCKTKGCNNLSKKRIRGEKVVYDRLCNSCHRKKYNMFRKSYHKYRKDYCENVDGRLGYVCTSTIIDSCCLTIDHKNGNRNDNRPKNLVTFCACCHNYKTKISKDFRKK